MTDPAEEPTAWTVDLSGISDALADVAEQSSRIVSDAFDSLGVTDLMAGIVPSFRDLTRQSSFIAMRARVNVFNTRRHVLQARTGYNLTELGATIGLDDCELAFDLIEERNTEGLRALADSIEETYDGADLDVALLRSIADDLDLSTVTRSLIADTAQARPVSVSVPCAHRRAHKRRDVATQPVCAHAPPLESERPSGAALSALRPCSPTSRPWLNREPDLTWGATAA